MARRSKRPHIDWYRHARPQYESLAAVVAATLEALLRHSQIDFLNVTHRAKSVESFTEKITRKRYSNPKNEMTDLAGIRVITYIERDIERVAETIRKSFNVHVEDCINKANTLAADQFGYRSVHLVCDIGSARSALPEFSSYSAMTFEIQVRTSLQHAWAEIEHDRSYKFAGELPSHLKRRFHLVAGLLELADREFNVLTEEIERYTNDVDKSAKSGDLEIEINSPSVMQFLTHKLTQVPLVTPIEETSLDSTVVTELRSFGVKTLRDLDKLLDQQFLNGLSQHIEGTTQIGVLRDAMMYCDIDRYFATSWNGNWQGWDEDSYRLMKTKYGSERLRGIVGKYELDLLPADFDSFDTFDDDA